MPTASRYANPRSNRRSGGLWELRYEPGPNFPWGVVARRSMLNADGREESTQDQGLETVRYIKDNKLGRIVRGLYVKGKRGGSALDPERVRITFADE
jgi:hypothetical protein